ncbi:MAG: hypothetical protein U0271_00985 [Polyangiaceae bacterium]
MELEELEALAFGTDRRAALGSLLAGSERSYYEGLLLQHEGALDEVDRLLTRWASHGSRDALYDRLVRRQRLLRASADLEAHARPLAQELDLRFDDQPEVEDDGGALPSALDEGLLDLDRVLDEALSRGSGLDAVTTWGIAPVLARRADRLDESARRDALRRAPWPGLPGFFELAVRELGARDALDLREIADHLTLDDLHALRARVPRLGSDPAWVQAVVARMQPSAELDPARDLAVRVAYLRSLWGFVEALPSPAFAPLKALVLYHRLDCDRRAGVRDRATFAAYLSIPRRVSYARDEWLRRFSAESVVALGRGAVEVPHLDPIGDDEALVVDYLEHFLPREGVAAFAEQLRADWLRVVAAEAHLLAGVADPEPHLRELPLERAAEFRDRVEIVWAPTNPRRFGRDEAVCLKARVKNVRELTVKVFRIDLAAYFAARGANVDVSIDLDGMIASHERVLAVRPGDAHDPFRRVELDLALDACDGPGTFVVDLVGNGLASRALVEKGGLAWAARRTVAGLAVRLFDAATLAPIPDGRAEFGGRSYEARADGVISLPFTSVGGGTAMLLSAGGVAQVARLSLPREDYSLALDGELPRESLVSGKTALALLRPQLLVSGDPAPLSLVQDATLDIEWTDLAGTSSKRTQPVELVDGEELEVELRVPDDAVALSLELRGHVEPTGEERTLPVAASLRAAMNGVHATEQTEALYLEQSEGGYALRLLGKSGEPIARRAVNIALGHLAVTFTIDASCATDESGRIALGKLPDIEAITATAPSSSASGPATLSRLLRERAASLPTCLQLAAGERVRLPRTQRAAIALGGSPAWSLVALAGQKPRALCSERVSLDGETLRIDGLEPGDYLFSACGGVNLELRVRRAEGAGSTILRSTDAMLEPSARLPLVRAIDHAGESLRIVVEGATELTRVHVFGERFLEAPTFEGVLSRPREARSTTIELREARYVSGRDLGDEYRYVLDRRRATRHAGLLLDKPSLLVFPWARRATTTRTATAVAGSAAFAPEPRAAPAPRYQTSREVAYATAEASTEAGFATFDFATAPAVTLANLAVEVDPSTGAGVVEVPLAELASAGAARIIVVDPAFSHELVHPLPRPEARARDRRLRDALDPERRFVEDRVLEGAPAGSTITVASVRHGKLELCDSIAKLHTLLLSLSGDETLRKFAFVGGWSSLDLARKQALYAEHACHELALFLHRKDPVFFDAVVRPALAAKRNRTVIDAYLLGDDLTPFATPQRLARLNALERALVAQAVPSARAAIVRLLALEVELVRPDPTADARVLDVLLGAQELAAASTASELDELLAGDGASAKGGAAAASEALADLASQLDAAPRKSIAKKKARPGAGGGGGVAKEDADMDDRLERRRIFKSLERTQEWAESDYFRLPAEDALAARVPASRFLLALASHASGPFLCGHLAECARSFTAAMACLAFEDLPFQPAIHDVVREDERLTLTTRSHALAARTTLRQLDAASFADTLATSGILVGQSYVRLDDRWSFEGGEQHEKPVTGALQAGVAYACRVVVSNTKGTHSRLTALLQIPRGSVPVSSGFVTRTRHLDVGPYATAQLEYAFYFPLPGSFTHAPAHVARGGELVGVGAAAIASGFELTVERRLFAPESSSFAHVASRASLDEVVGFIERENVLRHDLARLAWRMRERSAFGRILAALESLGLHDDKLWSYALDHKDRARAGEFLRAHPGLAASLGPLFESALVSFDPLEDARYQHLEYAPLVSARAHQLGRRKQVLNDGLVAQLRSFFDAVAHKRNPSADDHLAAASYMFALDRVEDALSHLAASTDARARTPFQFDYLVAYAACARGDHALAREKIAPWLEHPIDRWRQRFRAVAALLDELQGGPLEKVGAQTDLQRPAAAADSAAARERELARGAREEPALELTSDAGRVILRHARVSRVRVRLHRLDLELVFSRSPFGQADVTRFAYLEPSRELDLELDAAPGARDLALPDALARENLVIEAVSGARRAAIVRYANDLALEAAAPLGRVRVRRASTGAPLPRVYVKAFARLRGGSVAFYKDGYTDLVGWFDYATLSTDDLDRVERFALLVVSDEAGSVATELAPPAR